MQNAEWINAWEELPPRVEHSIGSASLFLLIEYDNAWYQALGYYDYGLKGFVTNDEIEDMERSAHKPSHVKWLKYEY